MLFAVLLAALWFIAAAWLALALCRAGGRDERARGG